ncbi:magnesium-translocating P-type ATPase [[Acholeplasma] multilocale]|uniref:magnesium-translocating P-type ATPase n=1 Tax=[Acholeplasma] multilocale TaxID=264638 RepID=UPI00047E9ACB|nr:magnesium-translocating P-type ATPase [[Acholeplasma] multilocale]
MRITKFKKTPSKQKKSNFSNEAMYKEVSTLKQEQVLHELDIKQFGLTNDEYEERLKKFGKNELKKNKFNWLREIGSAYFGPFNLILIAICAYYFVSYFTSSFGAGDADSFDLVGAIIVLAMVVISGTVSFAQSLRSFMVSKKIGSIVKSTTNIIRHKNDDDLIDYLRINKNNQLGLMKLGEEIDVSLLVPGDLIYLSSGDMVPADVRIIQSNDLFINQSSLTGESLPVEKHARNMRKTDNILDLENICYTGTSVVSGSALAVVITTANSTYFSTISKAIMEKRPEGSFSTGVKKVTRVLLLFMLVMVPIVYLINAGVGAAHGTDFTNWRESPWFQAIFFAIAVAVGLTPEMLPMIVTTNLANGAARMSKQKVVVKQLDAIQSLGAIDVLCTDKTGTLTNDKIELIDFTTVDKKADERLLKFLYMNSYFQTGLKNPMDKAIIDYVQTKNINYQTHDEFKKIDEIPFDFNRRKLTIVFDSEDDGRMMVTKGSVEEILKACTKVYHQGKVVNMSESIKRQIIAHFESVNEQGKRVLGVAYKKIENNQTRFKVKDEDELTFFGFASFLDTPKPSTTKMIKLLKKYGVDLKILTGDNEQVTRDVCKMVNLDIKGLVSGEQIENASEHELKKMVEQNNIFVKLNPLQKVKIIQVLKQNDHVVGYMGDGINDAPVLRQSDVAISVNNATDIAKDASDIILLEKSLLVLEKGIIQGRTIFGNILKYIKITTSSNFGNTLSMIAASAFLPFLPMLPVQILFQNLIYDFSQFAIAIDTVDESFLAKPQRWNAKDLVPFTLFNGPVSSIFDILTFVIAGYAFGLIGDYNAAMDAGNKVLADGFMAQFHASWFIIGLASQALVVHVLRTEKIPFIQSRSPWPVYVISVAILAIAFIIPYSGILAMKQPAWTFIPVALAILVGYLFVAQGVKVLYKKVFHRWL